MPQLQIILSAVLPLSIVYTLSWYGVFTFVNAYIIKGLSYSNENWTAVTLWFIGGVIFWQLMCTEISSRIGHRITVFLAMLVTSIAFAIIGFTSNLLLIEILLFFVGFMSASFFAAWLPMTAEAGENRPGKAMGITQFVCNSLGVLTIVAGGILINSGDYRKIFITFSATCFICSAIFYILTSPLQKNQFKQQVSLLKITKANLRDLLGGPFIWIVLAGICIEPFNFHTANQLFPNLARDMHGLRESSIGIIVGTGRIPALLSLFIISHFIDRLIPSRSYGAGILWAGTGIIFIGLSGSTLLLITGYFFFYLGHGIVWGANMASVNSSVGQNMRDSAFVIANVSMNISVFIVGAVHHLLLKKGFNLPSVFIICGIIACIGGITLLSRPFPEFPKRTGISDKGLQ